MPGGFAEYACVPERHLIRTPDAMSDVDAAAFQIGVATAYHMLFTRGELRAGETVLVNSVGSGVGSAAVQLARHAGAFVIGNASSPTRSWPGRASSACTRASTTRRRTWPRRCGA